MHGISRTSSSPIAPYVLVTSVLLTVSVKGLDVDAGICALHVSALRVLLQTSMKSDTHIERMSNIKEHTKFEQCPFVI